MREREHGGGLERAARSSKPEPHHVMYANPFEAGKQQDTRGLWGGCQLVD